MPELSVITPVFNVEPYLKHCIESILGQTFTDFELLLVDDGSTDRSGAICDTYAAMDSRVHVIHKKNAGVSAARNDALAVANGNYYVFIDSDDWIEQNMFSNMINIAEKYHAGIVICGANYCNGAGILKYQLTQDFTIFDRESLLIKFFHLPNAVGAGCCNKLFYAPLIRELRFSTSLALAEDWFFVYYSIKKCGGAVFTPDCYYNIREREGSTTRTEDVEKIYANILKGDLFRKIIYLTNNESHELKSVAMDKYLDDCLRYSKRIRQVGRENHQPWLIKFLKLRLQMVPALLSANINHLLTKERAHGFLYELLKG